MTVSISTFPHLFQSPYLLQFKPMSKAIDDPMIISIPSDYMQEDAIRRAIASTFSIPNLGECTLEMLMVGFLVTIVVLMIVASK